MSLPGSNRAYESFDSGSRSREDEGRDAPDANSAAEAEDSCAITSRICDLQNALDYLISVRANTQSCMQQLRMHRLCNAPYISLYVCLHNN